MTENPAERWLPLKNYESDYIISESGTVKRSRSKRGGTVGYELKPYIVGGNRKDGTGYPYVALSGVHSTKTKKVPVHILVAETFIGKRPDGYQINHIDGNRLNAHVSNLEYITRLRNMRHSADIGLREAGARDLAVALWKMEARGISDGCLALGIAIAATIARIKL